MTGIVGGWTVVMLQPSRNFATGMLPELVLVAPLVHFAGQRQRERRGRLGGDGLGERARLSALSCVPTGTTPGRLDAVIDSVRVSLFSTSR